MKRPYTRPMNSEAGDLWLFAYGSLMWRPDFDFAEVKPATIYGYHRALCMYSIAYRGTEAAPGLVFGLDRGGSCRGLAYRIAEAEVDDAMATTWAREMITAIYQPRWLTAHVDGEAKTVWAFVADRGHAQYAGKLSDDEVAALIMQGCGEAGHCLDYVQSTLDHLRELGIRDRALARIVRILDVIAKGRSRD